MRKLKKTLASALLVLLALLTLLPTTAFAAVSTGTGIEPTTNNDRWTTRLTKSGQPYAYKPPMAAGKLLYSAIHDMDPRGDKLIDVVMPVTEIDRANLIFERILYRDPVRQPEKKEEKAPSRPQQARQERTAARETQDPQRTEKGRVDEQEGQRQVDTPKKDFRSERDLPATSGSSSTPSRSGSGTTSERPSVEERLKGYQEQLQKRRKSALARQKTRARPKEK